MKIGLLGHGVVGRGVTAILDGKYPDLEITKILVKDLSEGNDPRYTLSAEEILNDPEIGMIVECMGGVQPAGSYVLQAMKQGKHAVTSNKKMLASLLEEILAASSEHHVQVRFEASCGGGIPWIHELEHIRRIDEITGFRGIMNGTTNYILSAMHENGTDFAEALKQAQKLGYAEQDPSDDIDGMDVRYKCCISLFAACGLVISPDLIPAFGIRHIHASDAAWAKQHDCVIKLIGEGSPQGACVMPRILKSNDPMSAVFSNQNRLETDSPTLGVAAFSGQGAGSLPTAHAVVQDILDIARGCTQMKTEYERIDQSGIFEGTYYISGNGAEAMNLPVKEKGNGFILTEHILLNDLMQALPEGHALFIAEVCE